MLAGGKASRGPRRTSTTTDRAAARLLCRGCSLALAVGRGACGGDSSSATPSATATASVTATVPPVDRCAPLALNAVYPHGLSDAVDCNYDPPYTCDQTFDDGMWYAAGLGGQYIVGHRGLDLVLVVRDYDGGPGGLWQAVRPALVALDQTFQGDEVGFCAAYGGNSYAPNLH